MSGPPNAQTRQKQNAFSRMSCVSFSGGISCIIPSTRYVTVFTLFSRYIGVQSLKPLRMNSTMGSIYLSNIAGRCAFSAGFSRWAIQLSTMGRQPTSVSLMKRMPARDTVAGVAFESELISKTMRIASDSGTRSLETSVSTLLSSITVFIDSIHTASMSPSSTTHL